MYEFFLEQFSLPSHGEEILVSVDFCNNERMYEVNAFLCGAGDGSPLEKNGGVCRSKKSFEICALRSENADQRMR